MNHLNKLTPAEAERLALLQKALGKGEFLEGALGDQRAAESVILEAGDLNPAQIQIGARAASENPKRQLHRL